MTNKTIAPLVAGTRYDFAARQVILTPAVRFTRLPARKASGLAKKPRGDRYSGMLNGAIGQKM